MGISFHRTGMERRVDEDQTYSVNDLVVYLGNTYKCNFEHLSTDQNFPGDNGSGFFYWDVVDTVRIKTLV
jgi:hypothetical protein